MYVTQKPLIFPLTYNPLFIGMFWKNAPKVPKERYFLDILITKLLITDLLLWVCTDLTACP